MRSVCVTQAEEEVGYEFEARQGRAAVSERRFVAGTRQLTAQERRAQQSRYSRRPAPMRSSGAHHRHNKRYGL